MKNIYRGKVLGRKLSLLVKSFGLDLSASVAAKLVGINRNTANRYYDLLRREIIKKALLERHSQGLSNGIEIDESYFGARRVRGKRGRGASGKIIVLGLLKRHGRVYASIIPNAQREILMPIIRSVVKSGSDIYTDSWRSYDALAIYGYNHKKVKHEENEFVRDDVHVNGIESFWSWAKRRATKFNGIQKKQFPIFLLETEWRFNHRMTILKEIQAMVRFLRKDS
jgi:transposase-like protein